jgi:hypothetical protein
MPDYSKAKIYRVFCGDDEYIGSTTRPLSERMAEHRKHFKTGKTRTTSHLIFQKHGLENPKIELIEEFQCENIEQLRKREGEIQRERKCVNRRIAGRAKTEYHRQYYQEHAEKLSEQMRQYRQEHAEERTAYNRQYYQEHAEQLREQKRQYYQEHAEKVREQNRQYRLRKNTIVSENP